VLTRARTAIALLFHVLLLQVSVLGGGMACATGWTDLARAVGGRGAPRVGDAARAEPATAHQGAHEAAHHEAAPDEAAHQEATQHGDASSHCVTASGCAAIAGAAHVVTPAVLATVHASTDRLHVRVPAFTRPAPEPPPPRG
jgi:hypothetical protein